jgi:hypothetical protein
MTPRQESNRCQQYEGIARRFSFEYNRRDERPHLIHDERRRDGGTPRSATVM